MVGVYLRERALLKTRAEMAWGPFVRAVSSGLCGRLPLEHRASMHKEAHGDELTEGGLVRRKLPGRCLSSGILMNALATSSLFEASINWIFSLMILPFS